VAILRKTPQALLCVALGLTVFLRGACGAEAPTEYQVKAVFVYNFSRFVEWPPQAFTAPDEPFVIGILGGDPFGERLDEAVRGERIDQHPLPVKSAIAGFYTLTAPKARSFNKFSPLWITAARSPCPTWTALRSAGS